MQPMPSWLSRTPTKGTKLGLGATVVRTPDDALRDAGVKAKARPSSKRSSLKVPKAISVTNSSSSSEDPPCVPPLPSRISPPVFLPVLITQPSSTPLPPQKVIVTLETCTQTYRTSLSTLTSRPSHLANFLSSLYPLPIAPTVSSSSSLYSTQSDDPVYRHHLSSQPLTSTVHIFLDRPSPPYAYILSYLRQPLIDSQSESLPYALQLHNYTSSSIQASFPSILQSRLDILIEVRDEAAYLNLEALHKLCVDEIKNRYNSKQQFIIQGHGHGHFRGLSSSSMQSLHSLQPSIYNLHPLQEKAEPEVDPPVSDIVLNSTSTTSSTSQFITNPPLNSISSPLPSSLSFASPGPSPAAIAIRRKSKQPLPAENIPRTSPTPQSFEARPGPSDRQQQPQAQFPSPNHNRSRSSSRSRPPPLGWI